MEGYTPIVVKLYRLAKRVICPVHSWVMPAAYKKGLILLLIAGWLSTGAWSFVHWETKKNDITLSKLPVMALVSCMGPFAYLAGWHIYSDIKLQPVILFKKQA